MASATISTRQKNISLEFIKKTAGYIAGATGGFISDVMPITSSTISGAKSGLQELNSTFSNTASAILPKITQLKNQGGFKGITNWFMQREEDFTDFGDIDSQLDFDVETDNSNQIAEAQISEWGKNANQISKTVLESSHKMVEAQVSATANLISSTDRQTAVISSGFDKTNNTLNEILKVLTKNTAALIETNVANNNSNRSSNDKLASGKFRFDEYKKMVAGNLKNSELGMVSGMLSMVSGMGGMLTPKDLIQMGIGFGVSKLAPNMKSNMKALDSAVGDVIMGSLIRLGEHRNEFGIRGKLAQIFGIDSRRQDVSTQRSSLELKAVPFDSISKEALVGAIPGYMRHMLIALGGPDLTYDYRSRSFKSKGSIKKDFRNQAISSVRGSLDSAGGDIKRTLGDDKFTHMMYDLMMNELGTRTSNGGARNTITKFGNKQETQDYILQTVLAGISLSDKEKEAAKGFANNLSRATAGMGSHQMMNQISRNNVNRNKVMQEYMSDADAYGMDLSFINDSANADKKAIIRSYGKDISSSDSKASVIDPVIHLKGTNYTNMALYEIYRRLNEGINVFQVGSSKRRRGPFEKFGDDYLTKPLGHKPKQTKSTDLSSSINEGGSGGIIHDDGSSNLLENQNLEDGSVENLSTGQRFTRWGKQRGGNLAKAMFSGSPEQVKEAFGLIVRDVTQVGGAQIKKGLIRVNDSFGNITGFMKHKLFGTGYSYDSGETDKDGNPVKVHIKDNKGGGVFGFVQDNITSMFKNGQKNTMKWVKDVAGYFDYRGQGQSSDEPGMESKRKKFMIASVGAMAGAGMLGGPLGMLFGAVAGNALGAAGIGDKIKETLFGKKNRETGQRDRKGLITRAVDGIVDPIKYQVGKSFNVLGNQMKKNILGPLSDIGFAIKDRISAAVSDTAQTQFGKVFGFIGKMLMMPFKAVTSTAKLPIDMLGSLFRGTTKAAGATVGTGLGLTASMIATRDGRESISKRREERNAKIDEDYKNDYKEGYKAWKSKQDDRRRENWGKLKDSTAEEKMTQSEIAESSRNIEESSAETAEATGTLARLGSEEGSIYTHDHGLHDRLDRLIELMGGKKLGKGTSSEDKAFVDSIIGATGSMMSTDGIVSTEEARLGTGIIDEAAKTNPSKSSVISKFKNLIGIQSKRKEEDPNKKESWFTKLLKTLSDNWVGLLGGALAGLSLFNSNFREFASSALSKFGEGIKNLWSWIKDGDKDGKNGNAPLNAVTSPLDMRTNSASSYLNPFADVYHVQKDAAGNDITNINATRAKDATWKHLALQATTRGIGSIGYDAQSNNHLRLADKARENGLNLAANKQTELANASASKAQNYRENLFGKGAGSIAKGMTNVGVGLAGGQAIGMGAGYLTSKVLQNIGLSEEWADRGGRVAETVGTIGGTVSMVKNGWASNLVDWGVEKSKWVLAQLSQAISKNKMLSAAAKPVAEFLGKVEGQITAAVLKPLTATLGKLAIKLGAQVGVGVLTFGVGNALMAGAGAIIQGCNAENLFSVKPEETDKVMVGIAALLGGIFNLPFVCLVEVIDIILAPINGGKGVRQSLAEIIYNAIQGDNGSSLSEKQKTLKDDVDAYNKKYNTNMDSATYNDMTNKGLLDKIWTGGTKTDENGRAMFDDSGARLTNGGMSTLWGAGDKISNEYNWAKGKVSNEVDYVSGKVLNEYQWAMNGVGKISSIFGNIATGIGSISKDWWEGEYERDEKGDPIVDENGQPVRKGGFKDWALGGMGKMISSATSPITNMIEGVDDWASKDSPWAKNGFTSPKDWMSSEIVSFWKPITDPVDEMITSTNDWINNESEWAKSQFKSAGELMSNKVSNFYTSMISPVNDLIDGIKDWVSSKAEWAKDGVKTWVGKKADSAWDMLSSPFKGLFAKADQENKDQASIANKTGRGGGSDEFVKSKMPRLGGIGGPSEAGDPLNKPVEVTSPFGERVHPLTGERKFHKGVDLVPADGGEAQVGAVYGGKVTAVGFEPGGAGNYVFYETNDGMTVKNMHMKDNSIPSNVVEGATIKAGDKLGDMGSTGGSTGPHLHYQIEKNGQPIDPAPFVDGSKVMNSFNSTAGPGGGSGASAAAGPLGALLGSLQNVGSAYLNKITGGLLGNKGNSGSSISGPGSSGGYSPSFAGLTGSDVPEKVYNFLRSKGCSHEAAIGILANMHQESGIDPTKKQVGGPAKGIVQWEGGRFDSMANLAASRGKDWTDLESQLEFMWQELNTDDMSGRMSGSIAPGNLSALGVQGIPGGFSAFKTINDAKYATALFEGAFERAGTPMMENRYGAISALNERLKGKSGKGGGLDELFSNVRSKITNTFSNKIKNTTENSIDSIINPPKNTSNPKPNTPKFSPKTTPFKLQDEVSDLPTTQPPASNDLNYPGVETSQPGETSRLESLMAQVLVELKSINGNTGHSSNLLGELNQKDFVDTGVRDSISQLGKNKQRKPQVPHNHGNTRAVNSIIRP